MSRVVGATRPTWVWEAALVGLLLGLSGIAWVATERLAMPHMRLGLLTGAGSMSSMTSASMGASASLGGLGLFLATWVVMMVAMMLPAVAPVVVTVDRWVVRTSRSRWATALFVAGYLLVWSASGVAIYLALGRLEPLLPTGKTAVRAGAGVLLLAGAYQFTPLKDVCLQQCRSPLGFVAQHATQLRQGGLGGMRVGVVHGLYCLGCCWALMVVLVLLGMMSLTWMAATACVIFLEKVLPGGWPVSGIVGLTLVATGAALLVSAQALPGFA